MKSSGGECPSCGGALASFGGDDDTIECVTCGAVLADGHWRTPGGIGVEKTVRKPKKDDMVLCDTCSTEFDHEAWYPRKALVVVGGEMAWLDGSESRVTCPRGHTVQVRLEDLKPA